MSDTVSTSARRAAVERDVLHATENLLRAGRLWGELSVERIALAAGISRPAFYFYFRDKRDLLSRLAQEVSELLYREAEAWWAGEGPADAALRAALEQMAALYREHGAVLRAVVEVAAADAQIGAFWRALLGRFVEATRRRIEAEQAAGRVDAAVPAAATAFTLTWMTERSFHQQAVQKQPVAEDELVDALTRIWVRALY